MDHNVAKFPFNVNIMSQDVDPAITGSITQADLAPIRGEQRLGEYAVVYRIARVHQGGGYGDQNRHPYAWAVAVYIDNQLYRLFNARGAGREWNSVDKLSEWLREQGFYSWWTRNDLEVLGDAKVEYEMDLSENPLFYSKSGN